MVKEAELHAVEDARRRQEIELRNQVDSLVYSTERSLAEHGAKLSETDRHAVEQALADARDALKGEEMERLRQAQDALTRASRPLADAMYRASTGAGHGGQGNSGAAKEGDVVDAEFKDVDDRTP